VDGGGEWVYLGPVEDVIRQFVALCKVRYDNSPSTIREQVRALREFLALLNVPGMVSGEEFQVALARLSKGARVHAAKAIKKLLRSLGREDLASSIKVPKYGTRKWSIPSDEDLRRFYHALDHEGARLALRLLAETGLRKREVLEARVGDINWDYMALIPNKASRTKKSGIGFFTAETAELLRAYITDRRPEARIFPYRTDTWLRKAFKRAEARTGVHVCPQMLRVRFADKMGEVDVPDRYVDIMQGRVPQTVLAKHYTPSGLKKLRTKWEKARELLKIA